MTLRRRVPNVRRRFPFPDRPEKRYAAAMLRAIYDRCLRLAAHRRARWILFAVAFVGSSVFPLPPDALLIPMVLACPAAWWQIAAISTAGSVLGGYGGYLVGWGLYEAVGRHILQLYGYMDKFDQFRDAYHEWGAWIVAGAGFTPFPYKLITIGSGVMELDPVVFGVASTLSRGARFFLVAVLLWRFGPPVQRFIEARLGWVALASFALLVGGWVVAKYLV